MLINKIDTNNNVVLDFGKSKNTNFNANSRENKTNNKIMILALGTLASAGIAAVALKNPKFRTQINLLKNKIGLELPKKQAETMSKTAAKTAVSTFTIASAMTALARVEKQKAKKIENKENEVILKDFAEENTPVITVAELHDIAEDGGIIPLSVFKINGEEFVLPEIKKAEDNETAEGCLSLEDFKNAQGTFFNGNAYLASEPYDGKIVISKDNEQIIMNYENGVLNKTQVNELNEDGTYNPVLRKTIKKYPEGTKVIKVLKRRYTKDNSADSVQWFTEKTYKINDSSIDITDNDLFNQELSTYYRKQKNGTWKGIYEDRVFDFYTGSHIIPRYVDTGKILTPRQYKKFMRG